MPKHYHQVRQIWSAQQIVASLVVGKQEESASVRFSLLRAFAVQ
jgi:hypothetical protein